MAAETWVPTEKAMAPAAEFFKKYQAQAPAAKVDPLGYYLGDDTSAWLDYDAAEVARRVGDGPRHSTILVDQGLADIYLEEQLQPELLEAACAESGLPLELRRHDGYDHGYYFISTFIEDHLRHHAALLGV